MPFTDSIKMVETIIVDKDLIDASPADVVSGKVYIGSTKNIEVGTMPTTTSHGDIILLAGESYNVPYGKNPLAFNVIAKELSDQTTADAVESDLLKGKTAWVNGEKITGDMPNIGSESETLLAGESHTISKGYHDGTGIIKARNLSDQTPGSAIADQILNGKIAWVNGTEITGSMPNIGSESETLLAGSSHTISKGYHDGTGIITADTLANQTVATAIKSDIVEGKTAWVNGEKLTGNIPKISSSTITLDINGEYIIPYGLHSGNGKVTQNIPTYNGQTVASVSEPQTLATKGHYMNGDIIVAGIDALNYQRTNEAPKDATGNRVADYTLAVSDNTATIKLSVDNWHDNATLNIYHLVFSNLIDKWGNSISLVTDVTIDWKNQSTKTYTYGTDSQYITISIGLESGTNAHTFTINNITSGKITITELFASRTFGDSHDTDD